MEDYEDDDDDFYDMYSSAKAGRTVAKHGNSFNVALSRNMSIAKRQAQRTAQQSRR